MKTIKVESYGNKYEVSLFVSSYLANNNMAIEMITNDGEPFSSLTVNLDFLMPGYAFIDTNNNPDNIEEIIKKTGIATPTGTVKQSGFCQYPLYEFDMDKLKEYAIPDSDYFML